MHSKSLLVFLLFFPLGAFASSVESAIKESTALPSDSVETKVALFLHLLNDEVYLSESSPDPQFKDFAKFSSTSYSDSLKLMEKYRKESSGAPYAPYDLDSNRTVQEMISQRIGGACGTHAQVVAELLKKTGIPSEDLRIVSAVTVDDYNRMCPGGKGTSLNPNYRGGASGHVFVQVKVKGQWKLINTTYAPLLSRKSARAEELQKVYQSRVQIRSKDDFDDYQKRLKKAVRGLLETDLEMVDFSSPEEILEKMKTGKSMHVPEFQSLPETLPAGDGFIHFRKMLIYDVSSPDQMQRHKFKDRHNLIASGRKESGVCRFNSPSLSKNYGAETKASSKSGTQ